MSNPGSMRGGTLLKNLPEHRLEEEAADEHADEERAEERC